MELRPYQVKAIEAIHAAWEEHLRTLLVLPTGCGKTIVFANVAKDQTREGRVLILAHRDELIRQAADKLYKAAGLLAEVEKGMEHSMGLTDVVVGSVQTMMSEKRLATFDEDSFQTIIVDEAHHALAKSYQNVLNHFPRAKVLGVTATPDRGDMKMLGEYFESMAYEYSLKDAVKEGYLSKIRVQTMPLDIDLTQAKVSMGDYTDGSLGEALEPYLENIADEMAKVCRDRHTVVFLPLISTSQQFRDILNRKGFRAGEVNGQSKDRNAVLKDFEDGKINVLCNSMLLTEGWDCPIVDCIVVLRPTKVRALYCQMIGRGTRLHPGKDHLLVLDFLWMTGKHNLVHPADIVCKKAEIAEKMTEAIQDAGVSMDLFEEEETAERNAREERERSLARMLAEREAKEARKKKKLIDPLNFAPDDLVDYAPIFAWESQPVSEKQKEILENNGIDTFDMTRGQAKILIGKIIARRSEGLATPRQVNTLRKYGFKRIDEWTFDEATTVISQLGAAGWKPWRANIVPEFYLPRRFDKEEAWS